MIICWHTLSHPEVACLWWQVCRVIHKGNIEKGFVPFSENLGAGKTRKIDWIHWFLIIGPVWMATTWRDVHRIPHFWTYPHPLYDPFDVTLLWTYQRPTCSLEMAGTLEGLNSPWFMAQIMVPCKKVPHKWPIEKAFQNAKGWRHEVKMLVVAQRGLSPVAEDMPCALSGSERRGS